MSEAEFNVNQEKVRSIARKIYIAEYNNLKTDNKSDKDMKQKIIDIIESEVDKCF